MFSTSTFDFTYYMLETSNFL